MSAIPDALRFSIIRKKTCRLVRMMPPPPMPCAWYDTLPAYGIIHSLLWRLIRRCSTLTAWHIPTVRMHPRGSGSGKRHIPTDLVVAQEASAVESSSRLDFLLLHNLGTSFVAP